MNNSRRKKAFKTENRLRIALYYSFQLLIDVLILFVFIKGFSTAYNFSHDIFVDSAKNLKDKDIVVVKILPDSSTSMVADTLYEAGVIKNKYVMMAKIKVNEVGGKIKAGSYGLSPSMTYSEIIRIITGGISVNEDSFKTNEDDKVATPLDAGEIHDNSEVGAGVGDEGDGYVPEDGGDGSTDGTTDGTTDGSTEGGDAAAPDAGEGTE